jgi:hypothetical protein
VGNLLGEALSWLPEKEAEEKLAQLNAGNGRFYWGAGLLRDR